MRLIWFVILVLSLIGNAVAKDKPIITKVDRVYDGDTFMITMDGLPSQLAQISVRIMGIDSPEMHGKCWAEKEWAVSARDYLNTIIAGKFVTLTSCSWDKYGSRIDCDVWVDGYNVGDNMLQHKMAVPYNGKKRSKNWCKI